MYIVPSSTVNLYRGVPYDTGRVVAFSSKAKQSAYFQRKLVQSAVPCTYVRRTGEVRLEVPLSVAKNCNYMSFVNPDFENVTWYAAIDDYEYINNGCTAITYTIDYFQSLCFEVVFNPCSIDREQLSVDDYNKSVQNPYNFNILELQTAENVNLPDDAYDIPNMMGDRITGTAKRSFLPGGPEDTSYEKTASDVMMYTLVMASPISQFGLQDSSDGKLTDWDSNGVVGTFPSDDLQSMFETCGWKYINKIAAGVYGADEETLPTKVNDGIGNGVPVCKYMNGYNTNTNRPVYNVVKGMSGILWPSSKIDTGEMFVTNEGGHVGSYKTIKLAGYIGFGLTKNNIKDQTLILAVNSYNSMQSILDIITKNDAVSSIIGCYLLPLSFLTMIHAQSTFTSETTRFQAVDVEHGDTENTLTSPLSVFTETITPIFSDVKNKKLLTFPYQYIEVTSPNGLKKEYKFEKFTSLQNPSSGDANDFKVNFTMLADLSGLPAMNLYPYIYDMYVTGEDENKMSFRKKLNYEERTEYDGFQQQAYMTDSYLAYVAQQYSQALLNEPTQGLTAKETNEFINSQDYVNRWDKTAGKITSYAQPFVDMGKAYLYAEGGQTSAALMYSGKSLTGAVNLNRNLTNYENQYTQQYKDLNTANKINNIRVEAQEWADNGNLGSSLIAAKGAFRQNIYHAGGSSSGVLPAFLGGFRYVFDVKVLKSVYLKKLDEFFTNYGYTSTRFGVPHIANFLKGITDGDSCKFLENGEGYEITYIKTVDCKITANNKVTQTFFETLFNTGVQIINGDAL